MAASWTPLRESAATFAIVGGNAQHHYRTVDSTGEGCDFKIVWKEKKGTLAYHSLHVKHRRVARPSVVLYTTHDVRIGLNTAILRYFTPTCRGNFQPSQATSETINVVGHVYSRWRCNFIYARVSCQHQRTQSNARCAHAGRLYTFGSTSRWVM